MTTDFVDQFGIAIVLLYLVARTTELYSLLTTERQISILHRSISGLHFLLSVTILSTLVYIGEPIAIIKILFMVTILFWQSDVTKHKVNLDRRFGALFEKRQPIMRLVITILILIVILLISLYLFVD